MVPQNFGKYQIREVLGQGAMGAVYKAWDTTLNRLVALKMMAPSLSADRELKIRFYREAQATAQLQHPNITTVYDFGEVEGKLFIAMELVNGGSLKELMAQEISFDRKVDWMIQVCRALAFAHRSGIVHRDVKPGNILVNADGAVKILDFGIAHLDSSDLTQTGTCLGTPEYMSPEIVRGQKVDATSDVFSTGIVFYELITGRKPFHDQSLTDLMHKIQKLDPPPVSTIAPSTPAAIDRIVAHMLQKDPARRYQDLDQAADDLKELQTDMILERAERVRELKKVHAELASLLRGPTDDTEATSILIARYSAEAATRRERLRDFANPSDTRVTLSSLDEELAESRRLAESVRAFISGGDLDARRETYRQVENLLSEANEDMRAGDYQAAQASLRRALELAPEHGEATALFRQLNAHRRRGASPAAGLPPGDGEARAHGQTGRIQPPPFPSPQSPEPPAQTPPPGPPPGPAPEPASMPDFGSEPGRIGQFLRRTDVWLAAAGFLLLFGVLAALFLLRETDSDRVSAAELRIRAMLSERKYVDPSALQPLIADLDFVTSHGGNKALVIASLSEVKAYYLEQGNKAESAGDYQNAARIFRILAGPLREPSYDQQVRRLDGLSARGQVEPPPASDQPEPPVSPPVADPVVVQKKPAPAGRRPPKTTTATVLPPVDSNAAENLPTLTEPAVDPRVPELKKRIEERLARRSLIPPASPNARDLIADLQKIAPGDPDVATFRVSLRQAMDASVGELISRKDYSGARKLLERASASLPDDRNRWANRLAEVEKAMLELELRVPVRHMHSKDNSCEGELFFSGAFIRYDTKGSHRRTLSFGAIRRLRTSAVELTVDLTIGNWYTFQYVNAEDAKAVEEWLLLRYAKQSQPTATGHEIRTGS